MKFRHVLTFVALLLFGVLVWSILAPSLHVAIDPANQIQCASDLKNLSSRVAVGELEGFVVDRIREDRSCSAQRSRHSSPCVQNRRHSSR